LYLSHIS
jgi:hypothetical protein